MMQSITRGDLRLILRLVEKDMDEAKEIMDLYKHHEELDKPYVDENSQKLTRGMYWLSEARHSMMKCLAERIEATINSKGKRIKLE